MKSAAIEGVKILTDLRAICKSAPYGNFFSFTQRYYDFESYVVFNKELSSNVLLALLARTSCSYEYRLQNSVGEIIGGFPLVSKPNLSNGEKQDVLRLARPIGQPADSVSGRWE